MHLTGTSQTSLSMLVWHHLRCIRQINLRHLHVAEEPHGRAGLDEGQHCPQIRPGLLQTCCCCLAFQGLGLALHPYGYMLQQDCVPGRVAHAA